MNWSLGLGLDIPAAFRAAYCCAKTVYGPVSASRVATEL